ncbi:MAG: DUF4358 domain-containing protein [Mobilitalea sp.]
MRKLITILVTMAITTAIFTGCTKSDTNSPAENNNSNNSATDDKDEDTDVDNNDNTATDNGNSDSTNSDITVDKILEAIKAAYGENYYPNTEITPEFLETEFGLTSDMYEEVKAEQPMISINADRVVVVKAAEGKADEVEAALNEAKDRKIADTLQYPMNVPKTNATKVVRNGDFICFLLVGAVNDSENPTEEELKQFAEDEVAKAVDAFNGLFK